MIIEQDPRRLEREMTETPQDGLLHRLRQAIGTKGLSLSQFAHLSGLPYPSLRDYYGGLRKPGLDATVALIRFTGVSANWLLLGRGSMFSGEAHPNKTENPLLQRINRAMVVEFLVDDDTSFEINDALHSGYLQIPPFFSRVLEQITLWDFHASHLLRVIHQANANNDPMACERLLDKHLCRDTTPSLYRQGSAQVRQNHANACRTDWAGHGPSPASTNCLNQ